jgi:hypothetical protein
MGLDTHPSYVTAAGATFVALCTIVVALRFYTRYAQNVKFGVDDWLCIPALVSYTIASAMPLLQNTSLTI